MNLGPVASQVRPSATALFDAWLSVPRAVTLFWTSVVLLGVLFTFLPIAISDNRWFVLINKFVLKLSATIWLVADARAHRFEDDRIKWYMAFSFVLTEITVPVYLVKSRGWKGAAKTSLWFAGRLLLTALLLVGIATISELFGIDVSF